MIQARPTRKPPAAIIIGGPRRGPSRSTIQPWNGVSQVSVAMKIEKATWMAPMLHPWVLFIGLTNRVQPYCRLAISTMQTTPSHSWDQRFARAATVGIDTVILGSQSLVPAFSYGGSTAVARLVAL